MGPISIVIASGALLAAQATDFGIRVVGGAPSSVEPATFTPSTIVTSATGLRPAAAIGARWGRVTSTYRTPAHNRAVGGVRNSWHLQGRAIDIARRPGVSHAEIAAAFRLAGYTLIESLDEGDHSHFAFGSGATATPRRSGPRMILAPATREAAVEATDWGIVTVSSRAGRGATGR